MSDTPGITPERRALLQGLAQQAAAWWRTQLEDPGYPGKFDNGDRSQAGELGQIMASMAALKSPGPASDNLARFEQLLTDALLSRLLRNPLPAPRNLAHLQGEHPGFTAAEMEERRARAAACATEDIVLSVDYGPEGLLREAGEAARVAGFPWKTTMWVCWDSDPAKCYIEVRRGYGRATQRLPAVGQQDPTT